MRVIPGYHTFYGQRLDVMIWWRWLPFVQINEGRIDVGAVRVKVTFWWRLP